MKKIISAILLAAMLLSISFAAIPINAASNAGKSTAVNGKDPEADGVIDYGYSADVEVKYTVANTYTLSIPATIALGGLNAPIPVSVGVVDMVIPAEHILHMSVASLNGFKVKDGDDSIAYTMQYGDVLVSEGTDSKEFFTLAWNAEDNRGDIELNFTRTQEPPTPQARDFFDTLSFSVDIEATGNLPLVDGKEFATAGYDQGQGSKLYVAEDVEGLASFKNYLTDLEEAGFEYYTSNVIGQNHFATFTGDGMILNVMYVDHYKEIRVVTDLQSEFALPGLAAENIYSEYFGYEPSLTLVSHYNIKWPGRMGYIYQLADGSFFVIDGGYTQGTNGTDEHKVTDPVIKTGGDNSAVPYMMEVFDEFAPDKNNIIIAGWLITHMHEDHYGAFLDLANLSEYKEEKSRITIEKLIYNESSMEDMMKVDTLVGGTGNEAWTKLFDYCVERWGDRIREKVKAHPGQQFFLRNLKLTIYTSQDFLHAADYVDPWFTGSNTDGSNSKYVNNTSLVSVVEFCDKKMLYLGDSSAANNPYVVYPLYKDVLDEIHVVQTAHHGYSDTAAKSVYESLTNIELVIWPSNAEHFYGHHIGYVEKNSYYGGTLDVANNIPLFKDGVKHYIHGKYNLTIKDFVNYTPVEVKDELQIYDHETWRPDINYIKNKNY